MINTLLMWLRELLPFFLLLSFSLAWLYPAFWTLVWRVCLYGALMLLPLLTLLDPLLSSMDGAGLDWCFSLLYLLAAAALWAAGWCPRWRRQALSLALATLVCIHLTNLSLYGSSILSNGSQWQAAALGTALGLGIGLSVAVLWYHFLLELAARLSWSWRLVLALLCGRQLVMAVTLWTQLDLFDPGPVLWNSSPLLDEQSEMGYLFQALLGYEATPSLAQLLAFVTGASAVLLLLAVKRGKQNEI